MYQVKKRDGKIAEFNLAKIGEAIRKAFEAQEKNYNQDIIDMLALKVTAAFEPKIKDGLVSVEDIQDSVESVLIQAGYDDVAKGYILYRKQREKIRNLNSTLLDYKELVDGYVKVTDWRVKENSTVTYSVGGGEEQTYSVSGVNIAQGAVYNFPIEGLEADGQGYKDMELSVTNVSGDVDAAPADNSRSQEMFFYPADRTRSFLVENFTGQECSNCPGGHADMEEAIERSGMDVVSVSYHIHHTRT